MLHTTRPGGGPALPEPLVGTTKPVLHFHGDCHTSGQKQVRGSCTACTELDVTGTSLILMKYNYMGIL